MRMNDCKKANNIEYCYCSTNLCNGITPQLQDQNDQNTDDEDILDGAGSGDRPPGIHASNAPNDKNGFNVIVEEVGGNSIETNSIETKTSGAHITTATMSLQLLLTVLIMRNN